MVGQQRTGSGGGDSSAGDAYAGALDHYTSPARRDWVKRRWEEPELVRVFDEAVAATGSDRELSVLDVGCGAGVGLELLRATPGLTAKGGRGVHYLGVDLDDELLAVATERFGDPATRFVNADIRDELPEAPHDLYLSTGVPYSHLTRDELRAVVTRMLAAARAHPQPTVLVIDVLGRYSIEWTTRWDRGRWPYRMSFFSTDQDPVATEMSAYGGGELRELIESAAGEAACALDRVELTDRSLVVGRHTATGEYTPGLRNYRQLVNDLADPEATVDLDELLLGDLELPDAPAEVTGFLRQLAARWDARVEACRGESRQQDPTTVAAHLQPQLAEELRAIELGEQCGLGAGHSLTATVVTRPGG